MKASLRKVSRSFFLSLPDVFSELDDAVLNLLEIARCGDPAVEIGVPQGSIQRASTCSLSLCIYTHIVFFITVISLYICIYIYIIYMYYVYVCLYDK